MPPCLEKHPVLSSWMLLPYGRSKMTKGPLWPNVEENVMMCPYWETGVLTWSIFWRTDSQLCMHQDSGCSWLFITSRLHLNYCCFMLLHGNWILGVHNTILCLTLCDVKRKSIECAHEVYITGQEEYSACEIYNCVQMTYCKIILCVLLIEAKQIVAFFNDYGPVSVLDKGKMAIQMLLCVGGCLINLAAV